MAYTEKSSSSSSENLTLSGYQLDTTLADASYLYNGIINNITDFDNSNYNLIIDNLSKALNISPENLSHYVNDSTIQLKERNYREALTLIYVITVFYAIILVSGIVGNLITCIVISRNKYMHTATNFYLFNLAVSDLLLLLSGLPQELYSLWHPRSYPFTDFVCITESTLLETAANVTVLTITAFSVERYIAICHPFRQHSMSKLSRAIKFILAIWLTAFILALPQAMQFAVIAERGSTLCTLKNWFYGHVFAVSGCVFFVGPMTAICVLYVLIGIKLKKSKLLHGVKRYDRGISAQTRVIRMLIAVAVAFFLCWAPFHAQRLMAVYGSTVENPSKLFKKVFPVLNHVSGVMYYLSTCINPLLYNIMSHKFRNAFKLTLARQCGLFGSYQTQNNNYYSALPRPNGSMRLNMSTLDHRTTVVHLNKRESDLSLLHDNSINNANRISMRSGSTGNHCRCTSVSSQSTLMTTLSKNDIYSTVTNVTPNRNHHLVNNYCNNNSSSCNSNRPSINICCNTTIEESNQKYSNSCSPTTQTPDDLQISSLEDNLDEMADCHRLKNVQRYQNCSEKHPLKSSAVYISNHHQKQFTAGNDNIQNEKQLPTYTAVAMSDGQPGMSATVAVIIPSKKLKSSSLGNCNLSNNNNNFNFRKSFESHPNSMMALNNGTNQGSFIISSNLKEMTSDHKHHHRNRHQHHHNQKHRENKSKKDFDDAINNTLCRNNNMNNGNNLSDSDTLSSIGNLNYSCSCSSSSNSSCSDTNKCDKFSSSISSNTQQQPKLNNEICDFNRISQSKQNNDSVVGINRIQNNLGDTNILTKSNSLSDSSISETSVNELHNKNLVLKNAILDHQKITPESESNQSKQSIESLINAKMNNVLSNTASDKSIKIRIPSTNNSNSNNEKFVITNKDNNCEILDTTKNLKVNRIENDKKNNTNGDDFNDLEQNSIVNSNEKVNLITSVKEPSTTILETTAIVGSSTKNPIVKNKKQKR
ncbi:putative uncharacterized protein DDB_G0282133 [Condylostylus longicornis]|uniref:putative uncharacterized protein DDB_G0282133 n=1 Tax=Condylostylus longicornis TaxID=2530218 RepID=UPI00244DB36C|nr:putative uncharacterized protein DDB_G0282133 [Condylostylus longicornis]